MSFKHGEVCKSGNSKSTLFRTDRVPLSEHPLFWKSDENHGNQSFNLSTEMSKVSSAVVGEFSRFSETCNVPKSARGKENSTVRIPLSEHPFVRSKTANVKAPFDEVAVGCTHSHLSNSRQRLVGDCDKIRKFDFYKSRKTSEDDSPVRMNVVKNPVVPNRVSDIDVLAPVARKSVKRKPNEDLQELNRSLFSDDARVIDCEDDTDYSQIEYSHIVGNDDAVLSDDDNESPFHDGYVSLGAPSVKCEFCQAYMWKEERTNRNNKGGKPVFSLCCRKGQIKLPKAPPTPSYLW